MMKLPATDVHFYMALNYFNFIIIINYKCRTQGVSNAAKLCTGITPGLQRD